MYIPCVWLCAVLMPRLLSCSWLTYYQHKSYYWMRYTMHCSRMVCCELLPLLCGQIYLWICFFVMCIVVVLLSWAAFLHFQLFFLPWWWCLVLVHWPLSEHGAFVGRKGEAASIRKPVSVVLPCLYRSLAAHCPWGCPIPLSMSFVQACWTSSVVLEL